jgi:hypothetical protein
MRAEHGSSNVSVARQFLNRSDVVSLFQHVSGKAMSERMATGRLNEASPVNRGLHLLANQRPSGSERIRFPRLPLHADASAGET